MKKSIKILVTILIIILLLIGGCGVGFKVYVDDYYHSDEEATLALTSEVITITDTQDFITFEPTTCDTGIIFYPGAKVEAESYAPICKKWAEEMNFYVVIVKMPYNLAILQMDKADEVSNSNVKQWYMAGHSLGGVAASSYISEHVDAFDGLILFASYSTKDLSNTDLHVLSLYGSNDKVLNLDSYNENKKNLPKDTMEYILYGGNHAQFGSYGFQEGDGYASISSEEQWDLIIEYTRMFMDEKDVINE